MATQFEHEVTSERLLGVLRRPYSPSSAIQIPHRQVFSRAPGSDWVVADAAYIEPVSGDNSLITGKRSEIFDGNHG